MKVTIPTSLSEITLNQWLHFQKCARIPDADEEFIKMSLVTLFCSLSIEQAKQISSKDFNEIAASLSDLLTIEPNLIRRFTHKNIDFGFIPNLDEMSAGEYIDLDKYLQDEDTYCNAMAVLFRPVTGKHGEIYNIEPYENSEKHKQALIDMPLEVALGAMVFFYHLSRELLKAMKGFLLNPKQRIPLETALAQSGVGISQLIQSLESASSSMMRLRNYQYTPSLPILNTVSN